MTTAQVVETSPTTFFLKDYPHSDDRTRHTNDSSCPTSYEFERFPKQEGSHDYMVETRGSENLHYRRF